MIKAKIHLDIYQFEFVELELEADTYEELAKKIREAHQALYKTCEISSKKD